MYNCVEYYHRYSMKFTITSYLYFVLHLFTTIYDQVLSSKLLFDPDLNYFRKRFGWGKKCCFYTARCFYTLSIEYSIFIRFMF